MDCTDVTELLVAWQDGELSPSGAAQVEEHLGRCRACAAHAARLAAVTPEPFLRPPSSVVRQLHAAVNVDAILAAADAPTAPPPTASPPRWVMWAAVALLAAGWGLSRWTAAGPALVNAPVHEIPADQFAPAAYTPDTEADYQR